MKKIVVALAVLLVVCIAGMLMMAIDQVAAFAARFHPAAGQIAFWAMMAIVAGAALFAVFEYYRLPVALVPPVGSSESERERYLASLGKRLRANPKFKEQRLKSIEEIHAALDSLQAEADNIIRRTAATVFVSTAAMQNGRLDGLAVLLTQTRMIWQIARLYVQRPSARDMIYLYGNVAGTALFASGLENIDLSDIFAPVTASMAPAVFGAIPGAAGVSHFVVRCVSHGAANAFLTLRVGEVARRYCEAMAPTSRQDIRLGATAAAVSHLRRIVTENVSKIFTTIGGSVAKRSADAIRGSFKWPWGNTDEEAAAVAGSESRL
ncbi:MAG TPA: DUF697 domain-containing protein [Chthoniobacterales bacterium]